MTDTERRFSCNEPKHRGVIAGLIKGHATNGIALANSPVHAGELIQTLAQWSSPRLIQRSWIRTRGLYAASGLLWPVATRQSLWRPQDSASSRRFTEISTLLHLQPAVLPTPRSISTDINPIRETRKSCARNLISAIVGGGILVPSSMASAHVDVGISIGIPGPAVVPAQRVYVAPPPIVHAPAPAAAYGYADDWRERDWHERAGAARTPMAPA